MGENSSVKDCYFEQLRKWVEMANLSQKAYSNFPYFLLSTYPQLFQSSSNQNTASTNTPNQSNAAITPEAAIFAIGNQRMDSIIARNGGYEFTLAPFWKRILAEAIDILIIMYIKLLVTLTVIDLFDLDLNIDFSLETLKDTIKDDYTDFISFSSDIIYFEIVIKLAVCLYEALWTMNETMNQSIGGATPGKIIMGLRIVHADAVVVLPPNPLFHGRQQRALLYPAQSLGFKRALRRALTKNIVMTFMFPIFFFVMFFRNNRTAYDLLSKTIVVEVNHAPALRRAEVN